MLFRWEKQRIQLAIITILSFFVLLHREAYWMMFTYRVRCDIKALTSVLVNGHRDIRR